MCSGAPRASHLPSPGLWVEAPAAALLGVQVALPKLLLQLRQLPEVCPDDGVAAGVQAVSICRRRSSSCSSDLLVQSHQVGTPCKYRTKILYLLWSSFIMSAKNHGKSNPLKKHRHPFIRL